MATCDGCKFLFYEGPESQQDVARAICMDPDKPARGKRRTVAVASVGMPHNVPRPAWCRLTGGAE